MLLQRNAALFRCLLWLFSLLQWQHAQALRLRNGTGGLRLAATRSVAADVHVTELGDGSIKSQYVLPVEIGGQRLDVLPDTGSFSLVVSSKRCPESSCPQRAFDPEASSTYKQRSGKKVLTYISGTMVLSEAQDEMQLFGDDSEHKVQRFWEVRGLGDSMADLWEKVEWDGVLGLSWLKTVPGGMRSQNESTVTETFGVQSFTICLGRTTMLGDLGGVDITPSFIYWSPPGAIKWSAATSYVDVLDTGIEWTVPISDVAAVHRDDQKLRQFACFGEEKCAVLVDSGTGTMTLPSMHAQALINQLGDIAFDCSNFDTLPDIHLKLGSIDVVLTREMYVQRNELRGGKQTCMGLFIVEDVALKDGTPLWILGLPFFRQFVVEFDRVSTPPRIGISPHPGALGKDGKAIGQCPSEPALSASTDQQQPAVFHATRAPPSLRSKEVNSSFALRSEEAAVAAAAAAATGHATSQPLAGFNLLGVDARQLGFGRGSTTI